MANLTTTYDIITEVLASCGELTTRSGASDYEGKALRAINRMQRAVVSGSSEWGLQLAEPFSWAKSQWPAVFQLNVQYSTGSVNVTQGSTAITLDTIPSYNSSNFSLAGRYLRVTGRMEAFRIATHTSGTTSATLDAAYTDTTDTGLGFTADQLDYTLASSILRLIAPMKVYRTQTVEADDRGIIEGIDLTTMNQDYPVHRIVNGIPTKFAIQYKDSSTSTPTVRMNRVITDQPARVEYDYIPVPTDLIDDNTTYPIIPVEHRAVLWYAGVYYVMLDKNDNRAMEYKGLAMTALKGLVEANKKERLNISRRNLGRIIPRVDLQSENVRKYIVQEVLP